MFDYIARPLYINKIRPYIGKSLIKVLIGQRRSGKSYLLYELMDLLKDEFVVGVDNIVYISKELAEFDVLKNDGDLLDYIKSRQLPTDAHKVLMIDEVQEIEQFEKVLRSLQAEGGWDIYISGSNANILSSELSTFLSGRYVEIEIFPLSYGEFLTFHKKPKGDESFIEYIKFGGLPYLIHLELLEEVVYPYLRNVYDSILLKDVVKRYRVRNVAFLQSLVSFLANNIGSIVSAKKIADYLLKERVRISPSVVINYLEFLNSVYFVFDVKRKAIGKKIFEVGSKHYFADLGIRHALFAYGADDIAKVLENLVYVQLRREGYEVFVGETEGKEIDFIAKKGGDKKYVQVAYLLNDQKTVEREFGNLLAIPDNYEKIVVSLDKYVGTDYKGIKVVNAMEFLTEFKL
ncbi:ATPase [Candidatus Peregrinibacteria bacterium CG11_big_fil_rev_8_21_14_0_20_41_10]|nr:MAG: ATPase [Candidatus Peregrinibacteria bacterium CG11_big_fil_rev_8_21_14_0_20_41_10]PIZ76657.1 MAG: ATPase [Candidatus Peregrinibacteria bacterium CG_4_10_14_0_2_um_filter_41_8]